MYKEVTQEYIKEQEDLGVEDVLLKFIEWRTYIAFFGITLTDEDKEKLHKMAIQIKEKLLPDNERLLLSWINKTHILDEENCSEGLDRVTTDIIFAKALINPNIITEAHQKDIQNYTDERDWLVFLSSPSKPRIINNTQNLDIRFFELRVLKESSPQSLYKTLWFETIDKARGLIESLGRIKDKKANLLFVNGEEWSSLTCQNYNLKQFMRDFEIGDSALLCSPALLVANFYMYIISGFKEQVVNIRGRYK